METRLCPLIEQRNAKCISNFKYKEKVAETNLRCYEKIDHNIIKGNIQENNFKESKQFMNGKNISKNKNNRRNYDGLKYMKTINKLLNNWTRKIYLV